MLKIKNIVTLFVLVLPTAGAFGQYPVEFGSFNKGFDVSHSLVSDYFPHRLIDTAYNSVGLIDWVVERIDSLDSGFVSPLDDLYQSDNNILTFRGGPRRDMPQTGTVTENPTHIKVDWRFATSYDTTHTKYGVWGGGSGWSGQPMFVEWSNEQLSEIKATSPSTTLDFGAHEVIVGSLCGEVYFINFDTGKASRKALNSGNVIKGTMSLDPRGLNNLYVGQGVPRQMPFGGQNFDLRDHRLAQMFDIDHSAHRGWGARDSSPIAVGDFLFWAAENGSLYKYRYSDGLLSLHSVMRYQPKDGSSIGTESSPAVWLNYLYFVDNGGHVVCVNIDTLRPVWVYDNLDDSDATIVVAEDGEKVYLYTGTESDKQGDQGVSRFTKLDAMTGAEVWCQEFPCRKVHAGGKHFDGGMFSTPLLGRGDCKDLIFSNFSQTGNSLSGELIAMERKSGEVKYLLRTHGYSWSSPVAMCNANGKMFIVMGDVLGYIYLIDGNSGKVIAEQRVGWNFESSPIVFQNSIVVGSRGREIIKVSVE